MSLLNLSELVFKVNTTELDGAITKIGELTTKVGAVNSPMAKLAKESKKTSEATKELGDETKKSLNALEKQNQILGFMTQGFSKGQASILVMAKATGLATDQMKALETTLLTMRKLQGGDPFDKSTSGLISLKNKLGEVREAYRQYGSGVQLTRDQTRELARDKERIIEKMKVENKSLTEIKDALRTHNTSYIEAAYAVNRLTAVEKERERQMRESANAARYLANEEDKVNSVLTTMGDKYAGNLHTSQKAAESVARYSKYLKQAGISGKEAADKLEIYRQKVLQVNKIEQQRQKDYLSRALAPQISDVVVSLAGGMNPMTVLLQQGLQVRDLIGQSGVAAKDLQESFRNAASQMVASIKGTAVALGSLLIGTLVDTGKTIGNFIIGPIDIAARSMYDFVKGTHTAEAAIASFQLALMKLAKSGIFLIIAALATMAIATYNVIKEENALNRALVLNNGVMGASFNTASAYAQKMSSLGVSTKDTTAVIIEMAKAGNLSVKSLDMIATTAIALRDKAGVPIADTVKKFSELSKEPAKQLAEFGKQSGLVNAAVLESVYALERQGKASDAAALAMKEYGSAAKFAAQEVSSNYGYITQLGMSLASVWNKTWDAIMGWGRRAPATDRIRDLEERLTKVRENNKNSVFQQNTQGLEDEIKSLQRTLILESEKSAAKQWQAQLNSDAEGWHNRLAKNLSDEAKFEQESVKIRQEGVRLGKSEKEIQEQIAAARAKMIKKGAKPEGQKETEQIGKEIASVFLRIAKANNEATQELNDYTASQKLALDIFSDPDFKNYPEVSRQEIANKLEAVIQQELYNKKLAEEREILYNTQQAYVDLQKKRDDAMFDALENSDQMNQAIADETQMIDYQASLVNNVSSSREKLIKIIQLELKLQKELRDAAAQTDESVKKELEAAARARFDQSIKNLNTEIATDAAMKMQTSLADAIETALFEGGKTGAKGLRDIIVAELKKPIRVFIEAFVNSVTGSLTGSAGGGGTMDIVSSLKKLYDSVTGGFTSLGNTVGSIGSSIQYGTTAFSQQSTMLAAQEAGMGTLSGSMGTMASNLGGALAGYMIGKMISGGYSVVGKSGDAAVGVGTAIGMAVGGPIGAFIGGTLGGIVNRAFGRKLKDTGIQGTFGGDSGFEGENYQFYKGGWFRSDKTKTSAMDEGTQRGIGGAFKSAQFGIAAMAASLGLATDKISGFTKAIKISFNGLSQEDAIKKLQEEIGVISNEMAQTVLGTTTETVSGIRSRFRMRALRPVTTTTWTPGEFVREGESALDALTRLSTSLLAANSAFNTLSVTLFEASLIGGDAASKLMDNFGGIENFNTAISSYYEAFYSEEERVATTTRQLTEALASMGMTLPSTNAEFRALIESQDLYTDSGRAAYAALVQLAPTFNTITEFADKAAEAAAELANTIKDLANAMLDEVKRLRDEILGSTSDSGLAYLQSQFAINTAQARAGDTTAMAALPELSQAIENAAKLNATSNLDIIRMQAWLADSLSQTATTLGVPAFASGGIHTGGARIVGENGPELEITGPSRIFNSNQTGDILNNGAVVQKLESLNYEMQMLRAEVRADVSHNAKTAKLLDRIIPDGDAMQVNANIDGGSL